MSIVLRHVSKSFGAFSVLSDVSLEVGRGELVALLGPSGSGKTSLLRIIAGLERPDTGTVELDGAPVESRHPVGFVFQHYALFKHMTVFENVAFGLRVRPRHLRPAEAQIASAVNELIRLVHLEGLAGRYPSQLSGGQRQRVALARALAVEPSVLLLDEPFGALDAKVRKDLRRFIRNLHEALHITSVFVTHDQEEALEVADRVVVMNRGRIEQVGAPRQIYTEPVNAFVYDFLGHYNAFEGYRDASGKVRLAEGEAAAEGEVEATSARPSDLLERARGRWQQALTALGIVAPAPIEEVTPKPASETMHQEALRLFCRPHELVLSRTPQAEECVRAQLTHINPAGPLVKIELRRANGQILEAEISPREEQALSLRKGDTVFARPTNVKVFE